MGSAAGSCTATANYRGRRGSYGHLVQQPLAEQLSRHPPAVGSPLSITPMAASGAISVAVTVTALRTRLMVWRWVVCSVGSPVLLMA